MTKHVYHWLYAGRFVRQFGWLQTVHTFIWVSVCPSDYQRRVQSRTRLDLVTITTTIIFVADVNDGNIWLLSSSPSSSVRRSCYYCCCFNHNKYGALPQSSLKQCNLIIEWIKSVTKTKNMGIKKGTNGHHCHLNQPSHTTNQICPVIPKPTIQGSKSRKAKNPPFEECNLLKLNVDVPWLVVMNFE